MALVRPLATAQDLIYLICVDKVKRPVTGSVHSPGGGSFVCPVTASAAAAIGPGVDHNETWT